jgi:hypothetical protein
MKTMNIDIKVNILGSEWTVRSATEAEDPRLEGKNGFTDWTTRLICLERELQGDIGSMETYMNKVIRHELIHAFMDESGFGDCFEHKDFGQEETVVDWFAYQMPKIMKLADDICKAVIWGGEE